MYSVYESFKSDDKPQQGSEKRTSILPTGPLTTAAKDDIGFFGSSYNPADAMMTPGQINVKVGDSMDDVANAVKGVGFYIDQIGFGAPSTALTNGMPLKPLGVNYFIKTGVTCSNGAEMWEYMKGITEGDALGTKLKNVMRDMGLPPLQGLAPGMIEDVKNGLNPAPLMNSLFGSGYPQCREVTRMVGDAYGNIRDPTTKETWISDPSTAKKDGNVYKQTRWVQDVDSNGDPINLTHEKWEKTPKTRNKDGTKKSSAGFEGYVRPGGIIVIGVLCVLAFGVLRRKSF